MNICKDIKGIQEIIDIWKQQGLSIGFVPTMGYLHAGHSSLIEKARKENDKVVVSIFVNPIQFGPNEDFARYPRDLERDAIICEQMGTDVIFAPSNTEMYPSKPLTYVDIEDLGNGLCGAKRPGHFRGVCTVVSKLFNIISPDRAYFGEKDAQQLAIIKRMKQDLNFRTEIIPCPIVREPDGLAMSSRNTMLSPQERSSALVLSRSLNHAQSKILAGEKNAEKIKRLINEEIAHEPMAKIDYIDVVDAETLVSIDRIQSSVLVAIAVFIGKTRLIDNFTFTEK